MTGPVAGSNPREDPKDDAAAAAAAEAAERTPAPRIAAAPLRGPALRPPRQHRPPRYVDNTHKPRHTHERVDSRGILA